MPLIAKFKSYHEFIESVIRLTSNPSSNASVESIFFSQGRIHSKDRNRLLNSKVEKIFGLSHILIHKIALMILNPIWTKSLM